MFDKMAIPFLAVVAMMVCTSHAVEIETVPVGNAGNAADDRYGCYGAVAYDYNIGTYEVTAGQYTEFLNSAAASDPFGLYNSEMWSGSQGCKIQRSGTSGSYTYSVAADRENRPVNFVSFYDAARFTNWLTTGDTETGVYTFDGTNNITNILDHETAVETLGSTAWFTPTEDEWYKAAYHKNDGTTGNYWDYPTGTNVEPSNDLITPDPGNNANFYDGAYTIGGPYWTTEVGEFENSESPYGTFDQGGNLWEWNETTIGSSQGLRGGRWYSRSYYLLASARVNNNPPTFETHRIGFRVASILGEPIAPLGGDLNGDGIVGSRDLDLVRSWWSMEVEPGRLDRGDATGDGLVNSRDLDLIRSNWGAGLAAVPEPGVLCLVFSGIVLLAWRWRVFGSLCGKTTMLAFLPVVLSVCMLHAVEIETVPIGNPGNVPDTRHDPGGIGAVEYEYNIGKYEVTAEQYCEFLNAVAVTDTFCLYNTLMGSHPHGCQIQRSGSSGNYSYSVESDWANRPANFISWGDAARFCNWLHNGQPSGAQDLTTTEDGAYFLIGGTTGGELEKVERELDWKWAIPTEDEWYKSGYYDPATSTYNEYPTSSNTAPGYVKDNGYITGTLTVFAEGMADPGNNASYWGESGAIGIGDPYYRTEVGEWENSGSPYGTFDQGGNVREWNETKPPWGTGYRGYRGGYYFDPVESLAAGHNPVQHVTHEGNDSGFRVVSIAESVMPVSGDLNADGMVGGADLDIIRANWGAAVESGDIERGDANGDGLVSSDDLDIVRANWGAGAGAVPEPGVLLLSIGGSVLLAWRRGGRARRETKG